MAKYHGMVGYIKTVETKPGVWTKQTIEKEYCGEDNRAISRWQTSNDVNDDVNIDKQISIVANPFALENFMHIRYITVYGYKWKVNSVEIKYPRLILSVGGLYNGDED